MKSKLVSAALSIVLVFSSLVAPVTAQDPTVDALRQQIQMLLAQVAALQAQLAKSSEQPTSCPNITYNLYLGLNDSATQGQVSQLQKFLATDSSVYPEASITGYFGPLTEQAVQRFQRKHNIVSSGSPDTTGYGVVGRATRGKIREMCGTTTPPPLTPSITVLSPNGGETWVVGTEYTISWSNRGFNPQNIKVYLYRESSGQTLISEMLETSAWQTTLKYTVPSSITVARDYKILVCDEGMFTETPAGKYLCDMSDTTFSMVQAGGSNSPIISGVSGPTILNVGQSGTWTVNARDPLGGTLSYSVNWGDESSALTPTSSGGQTASFTHTYTRQGIFNPTFTVSNSSGSERTSVSVQIGQLPTSSLNVQAESLENYTVVAGARDVVVGIIGIRNMAGERVTVSYLPLASTVAADSPFQDLSLYDQNGTIVAGPVSGNLKTFTDSFTIPIGFHTYTLKANVHSFAKIGTTELTTKPDDWKAVGGESSKAVSVAPTNTTVHFGTLYVVSPGTGLTISPSMPRTTLIEGGVGAELGRFILDATKALEDVRIVNARIYADVIVGDMDNFQNLQLFDGNTMLNTGSKTVNPAGTPAGTDRELVFTLDQPLFVAKGAIKTFSLKGNILTSAENGDAIKFDFSGPLSSTGWLVVTVAGGIDVAESLSTAPGGIITIIPSGGWSVESAPSMPVEKWVPAGATGVTANVLRIRATNEDIALSSLRLQLRQPARGSDVTRIYLYDGNTLIASKVPAFTNGVEDFTFPTSGAGSFSIAQNSYKEMTVKVDLASIGTTLPGTAGQFVAVDFDGDGTALGKNTAVGMLSGSSIRTSTQTDVLSNGVRYFRSLPTLERSVLPVTTLVSGNNVLYKFRVRADSAYDIALRKVTFEIAATGIAPFGTAPANFTLRDITDGKRVSSAVGTSAAYYSDPKNKTSAGNLIVRINADTTDYGNPWVTIPAGQTHTFELRGDVTLSGAGNVSTRLLGDGQYPALATPMGTAAEVEASLSSSIIWSDFSADAYTTHSLTTKDWTNGFKLPGLLSTGLDSSTLSGDGVNPPPSITVLSPNGGEMLSLGSKSFIKWCGNGWDTNSQGDINIYLMQGSQTLSLLASLKGPWLGKCPEGASYDWIVGNVPSGASGVVLPGNNYFVRVVAVNPISGSSLAQDISNAPFTIASASDITSPSAPTNLVADAILVPAVNLIWNASTDNVGVTGYKIERCPGSSCTNFAQIGAASTNFYTDTTALHGVAYRYRVRATDAAGNLSGYSNIIAVTANLLPGSLPGTVWRLELLDKWTGTWTRKTGTDIFNAVYTRPFSTTVMGTVAPKLTGSTVTVPATTFSDGNICSYTGTLALDRKSITGTYTCTIGGTRVWKVLIDPPSIGISSATPTQTSESTMANTLESIRAQLLAIMAKLQLMGN